MIHFSPSEAQTSEAFVALAGREHKAKYGSIGCGEILNVEYNVPADGLMLLEAEELRNAPVNFKALKLNLETGMLQLGLLNHALLDPGSDWLNAAAMLGWRFRISRGFFRAAL